MRKGALASALSVKSAQGGVVVIESMDGTTGKTKEAAALLEKTGLAGAKVLVIVPNEASNERELFARSLRNIERVTVVPTAGVNVYDLLNSQKVLFVHAALAELEARVG
jgi:large subunit ribosomal protein L4